MLYSIVIAVCTLFRFSYFFLGSLLCSRTPSSIPYVQQSCLLALLLAMTVSQTFLVLMSLTILTTTGHIYHWMAIHWNLSDIILMFRLKGMGILEREITEVNCHSHHIRASTTNKTYDCWCWLWSSGWGFSPVKPLFPLFPFCTLWKKLLGAAHAYSPWGWRVYGIMWNSLPKDLHLLHNLLIYSII